MGFLSTFITVYFNCHYPKAQDKILDIIHTLIEDVILTEIFVQDISFLIVYTIWGINLSSNFYEITFKLGVGWHEMISNGIIGLVEILTQKLSAMSKLIRHKSTKSVAYKLLALTAKILVWKCGIVHVLLVLEIRVIKIKCIPRGYFTWE